MASTFIDLPATGIPSVPTAADLPAVGSPGQVYIAIDTGAIYGWSVTSQAWETGGTGSGTVSSVAMTVPSFLTVSGSPITTTGTLAVTATTGLTANEFLATPNGSSGALSVRAIVAADIPTLNQNTTGTASNITASSNSTLTTLSALSLPTTQLSGDISLTTQVSGVLPVANATIGAQTLTESGGATTVTWSNGNMFILTLSANLTVTFSGATSGQNIQVVLTNTASNYTVTWPTIRWTGGTAPVQTVGAFTDVYTFLYDGTHYYGSAVQNMS